jgi:hypothetical protein
MTPALKKALFAAQTGEVILPLLTVTHPDMPEPIRVVRNTEDVTSRGHLYRGLAFGIPLPRDDGETQGTVRITLDNVDQRFTEAVRTTQTPAEAVIEFVLASDPDTVEAGPWTFTARSVAWNAQTVEFDLGYEDVLNAQHLVHSLDPNTAPGMFR